MRVVLVPVVRVAGASGEAVEGFGAVKDNRKG